MRISRLWPVLLVLSACSRATTTAGGESSGPCTDFAGDRLPDGRSIQEASDSLARTVGSIQGQAVRDLTLVPYSTRPVLKNPGEVARAFAALDSHTLQSANGRAPVLVAFWIDTSGQPRNVQLLEGGTDPRMNEATLQIVERFKYAPAQQGHCPVPIFVVMPVNWTPQG